jgi:hypothetical protein
MLATVLGSAYRKISQRCSIATPSKLTCATQCNMLNTAQFLNNRQQTCTHSDCVASASCRQSARASLSRYGSMSVLALCYMLPLVRGAMFARVYVAVPDRSGSRSCVSLLYPLHFVYTELRRTHAQTRAHASLGLCSSCTHALSTQDTHAHASLQSPRPGWQVELYFKVPAPPV